jgi:hypothetical protein
LLNKVAFVHLLALEKMQIYWGGGRTGQAPETGITRLMLEMHGRYFQVISMGSAMRRILHYYSMLGGRTELRHTISGV